MAEDKKIFFADVVSKCWLDEAFKKRFLADPKKVLAEFKIEVPDDMDLRVVENTNTVTYLTIPMKPSHGSELTDQQLDAVSGGAGTTAVKPTALTPAARTAILTKVKPPLTASTCVPDWTCT